MGLFKNRGAAPVFGKEHFGYAALHEHDVEDARRRRPAVSLQTVAPTLGLEFVDRLQPGAFISTLPLWPDYIFNGCRGTLPSGRPGMLAHELMQIDASNGTVRMHDRIFVDIHEPIRWGGFEVGGIRQGRLPNEPFVDEAVWSPSTTVHVRVPETRLLPVFHFSRSSMYRYVPNVDLEAFGLPNLRRRHGDRDVRVEQQVIEAIRPWVLSRSNDAHLDVRIRYGMVAVTVNGYRSDPADLQHLTATADGIAGALVALVPGASSSPFTVPGPSAGTVAFPPGIPTPNPRFVPQYAAVATAWGMHHEDPSHVLMLSPRCGMPGMPSGVVAGTLPGTAVAARLVWCEHGGRLGGTLRPGVVVPAAPGASTPPGGWLDPARDLYVEVADGLVACWRKQRLTGELGAEELVRDAMETLAASKLTSW